MYSINYQLTGKTMYDYGRGYFFTIVDKIPKNIPDCDFCSDGVFRGIYDSREKVVDIIKTEIKKRLTKYNLLYGTVFETHDVEKDDYYFQYSGPLDEGTPSVYFIENDELVCNKDSKMNILNCPISNSESIYNKLEEDTELFGIIQDCSSDENDF